VKLSSDESDFPPRSDAEMIEQARYYEDKAEGLGGDFLDAVEETVRRVASSPEAGAIERVNTRKRLVSGFPFTILYEIQPTGSISQRSCINIGGRVIGQRELNRIRVLLGPFNMLRTRNMFCG